MLAEPDTTVDDMTPRILGLSAFDGAALLELLRDPVFVVRLLRHFRDSECVVPGPLETAIEAGDAASLAAVAHRIKGVAGNLRATRAHAEAVALEAALHEGAAADAAPVRAILKRLRAALDEAAADIDAALSGDPAAAPGPVARPNPRALATLRAALTMQDVRAGDLWRAVRPALSAQAPEAARRADEALERMDPAAALAALDGALPTAKALPDPRQRILIVDDSPENVEVAAAVLKRVADVSYALSGADGLRLARGLGPDLILLDIEMPGMSGLDAIRALKAEPATTAIPVIFLTGRSGDADEASGLELGAIDYIAKPFNAAIMTARVRNQLQLVSYAKQLQALNEELERRATTDALTGLPNRRAFMETAAREAARFRRFGDPMGLLMIDIDHFKSINDTHGHDIGDIVLREVARRLAGLLRDTDTIGRLGGEEFAVILPRTDAEGARAVADRLLHALRGRPIPSDAGPIPVTATIGLSMLDPVETAIDAALKRADVALYDGKRGGRDRVVTG